MKQQGVFAGMLGAVLSVLLVTGCARIASTSGPDSLFRNLDLSAFAQIPGIEKIDSGAVPLNLQPAPEVDYWELRGVRLNHAITLARGGRRSKDELPPTQAAEIDAIGTGSGAGGFGRGCLPGWCFKYVVAVRPDKIEAMRHPAELAAFLGEIDTRDEAILLAEALGYRWGASKEEAAIREVADGYDLLVLKFTDSTERCEHGGYRADLYRMLLHLSRSGTMTEQGSHFLERGNCAIP